MKQTGRRVVIAALALAALLAACSGGDDKKKDQSGSSSGAAANATATTRATTPPTVTATAAGSATASPSAQAASGDCFAGLRSYRYDGTVKVKLPGGQLGGAQQLGDIKLSGSVLAPDRSSSKVELGGQTFELISVGSDVWVRQNNGSWEKNPTEAASFAFKPEDICRTNVTDLQKAGLKGDKERLNGVDAVKYQVTKKDLDKLAGGIEGAAAALATLADDLNLSLWATEKEQWPVRILLIASQRGNDALSLNAEFNVTDFNKSDIKIDAPR